MIGFVGNYVVTLGDSAYLRQHGPLPSAGTTEWAYSAGFTAQSPPSTYDPFVEGRRWWEEVRLVSHPHRSGMTQLTQGIEEVVDWVGSQLASLAAFLMPSPDPTEIGLPSYKTEVLRGILFRRRERGVPTFTGYRQPRAGTSSSGPLLT